MQKSWKSKAKDNYYYSEINIVYTLFKIISDFSK